jgi:tryptophanase
VIYLWQAALVKDPTVSVNKCVWSPDGTLLGKHNFIFLVHMQHQIEAPYCSHRVIRVKFSGAAFSKHAVHIYSYLGGSDLRTHLEV